jgi:hypothetical protein
MNLQFVLRVSMAGAVVFASPPAQAAKPPPATTQTVNVAACKSELPGAPVRCPNQGPYVVIETKTDVSEFRLVVFEEESFQVFLEPRDCQAVNHDDQLEWRLVEGQPFAVIQVSECLQSDDGAFVVPTKDGPGAGKNGNNKNGNKTPPRLIVVVKGLKGFEKLDQTLVVGKERGAAAVTAAAAVKKARALADRQLTLEWPRIENARAEAARVAEAADDAQDQRNEDEIADGEATTEKPEGPVQPPAKKSTRSR